MVEPVTPLARYIYDHLRIRESDKGRFASALRHKLEGFKRRLKAFKDLVLGDLNLLIAEFADPRDESCKRLVAHKRKTDLEDWNRVAPFPRLRRVLLEAVLFRFSFPYDIITWGVRRSRRQ